MVAAELDEAFVQRMRDEVVVVIARGQGSVQMGLELQRSVHATELEVAQPQIEEAEARGDACAIQLVVGRVNHETQLGKAPTRRFDMDPRSESGVASPSRTLAVEGADPEGSLSGRAGHAGLCRFPPLHLGPTRVDDIEGTRDELVAEIAAIASAVLSGNTLEETLRRVVSTAVSAMDGCDSAGVFVVDGQSVRSVAYTSDAVVDLDRLQDTLGEGPCLDAAKSAAVVYVSDLSEDERYSRFGAAATTADIRTVLACPLSSDGMRGALNLYARLPNVFGATDRAKGTILAALAGAAIASTARRADLQSQNVNLQAALVSRELIGQAQGILMERERVSAEQAFDILRRASQHLNEKLRDVAQNLVETGESPNTGDRAPS